MADNAAPQLLDIQRVHKFARPSTGEQVRINYIQCRLNDTSEVKDTILLIHGFPLTSHQFRHVIRPLAEAGYDVIAPDYTGAGGSSKPISDYSKKAIALDLHEVMKHVLGSIPLEYHVVAHDIGAAVGHALVSNHPDVVKSAIMGECPLPGTTQYQEDSKDTAIANFHFQLHSHPDLAVALISGREEIYLRYFFDKQAYNTAAITDEDVAVFVKAYSQPGAIRAAGLTYTGFEQDLVDNTERLKAVGKCKVPVLGMTGAHSHHAGRAGPMLKQLYESVEALDLEEAGHYIAMENPEGFVREVLTWVGKHT